MQSILFLNTKKYLKNNFIFLTLFLLVLPVTKCKDSSEEAIEVIEGFGGTIEHDEEDGVLVLTKDNFDYILTSKEYVLVEFYAPWCGHCKSLAPEYADAAEELKENTNIVLAKLDATVEEKLAEKYDISGFPTLKLFKDGQYIEDYSGERDADGIVDYMKRHADPNYVPPPPPPSDVLIITQTNFSSIVEEKKLILVEFYAPWCGHCKKLAPEYDAASVRLKESGIALAKVDATEETDLAKQFDVTGYPTLLIFRYGRKFMYKGPRKENGIVDFMLREAKLPSEELESHLQAKNRISRTDPSVIAFFTDKTDVYEEYISAANELRGQLPLYHTFSPDVSQMYSLKENSVSVIYPQIYHSKYEQQKYTYSEEFVSDEIVEWLKSKCVPLVGQRTNRNAEFKYKKRPLLVVYYDVNFSHQYVKDTQFIRNRILPVAKQHSDISFAICNEEEYNKEMKELGLDESGENINVGLFGDDNKKYAMEPEDEFDSEVLQDFIEKYKKGKLQPRIKSQSIPKTQKGSLLTVVAKNFESELIENQKDVLVEFYAPWCGHCKQLEPIYKKFAKKMSKTRPNLIVAKIDATANEVPNQFDVKGFPTIYFMKGDDKQNPVVYDGNRTLDGFLDYISKNGSPVRDEL